MNDLSEEYYRIEEPRVFEFIDNLFPKYGIDPSQWEFSEFHPMAGDDTQYYAAYYGNKNDENVTLMIELSEKESLHENTTTLTLETLEMSLD